MTQRLLYCAVRKGILFPENFDYNTLAVAKEKTQEMAKREEEEHPWMIRESPIIRYARLKIEEVSEN